VLGPHSRKTHIANNFFRQGSVRGRPLDFSTTYVLQYNIPFSELTAAISTLKSVAEGPDIMHNDIIIRLPAAALDTLLEALNAMWTSGTFPPSWREAIIVPIRKPNKSCMDPLHYRPISLTCSLCKLFEKNGECLIDVVFRM